MNNWKLWLSRGLLVAGLFVLCWVILNRWECWPEELIARTGLPDIGQRGQFGDSYGALNTLFTGFAFATVVFSILLQILEAGDQRATAHRDQFESRVFYLIERYTAHTLTIDLRREEDDQVIAQGKDCFRMWAARIDRDRPNHPNLTLDELRPLYESVYSDAEDDLGTYFRLFYHSIRFVDQAKRIKSRSEYTDLIRAGLGESELRLLAFNGHTTRGAKFKTLIERYHLLKHVSDAFRQLYPAVIAAYDPSAFAE